MKEVLSFLSDLHDNNNREWFLANKGRYRSALDKHHANVEQLIARMPSTTTQWRD